MPQSPQRLLLRKDCLGWEDGQSGYYQLLTGVRQKPRQPMLAETGVVQSHKERNSSWQGPVPESKVNGILAPPASLCTVKHPA